MSNVQTLTINFLVIAANWGNYDLFTFYHSTNATINDCSGSYNITKPISSTVSPIGANVLYSLIGLDV